MKKVEKIFQYKGGYILIRNEGKSFEYIVFYRGKFYSKTIEFTKDGDYSLDEFNTCMEAMIYAGKCEVDNLRRSLFIYRFIYKICHYLRPKMSAK